MSAFFIVSHTTFLIAAIVMLNQAARMGSVAFCLINLGAIAINITALLYYLKP